MPPPRVAKDAPFLVHLLARAQISGKAFKMATYGALVSAPLSHVLVNALQKAFAGQTGLKGRLGMLVASQLIVAPIQIFGEWLQSLLCVQASLCGVLSSGLEAHDVYAVKRTCRAWPSSMVPSPSTKSRRRFMRGSAGSCACVIRFLSLAAPSNDADPRYGVFTVLYCRSHG